MVRVLKFWGSQRRKTEINQVEVLGCSEDSVNGQYFPTSAEVIPPGFQKVKLEEVNSDHYSLFIVKVCQDQGWPPLKMWQKLNSDRTWYRKDNEAYIYWNTLDCSWWIDKVRSE